MTLAALADLAEIIGALAVVAGLVFVGVQLHQQTKQLRRSEANEAMAQASALRHAVFSDPEFANMLVSGLAGAPLDAAGELRLRTFFNEVTFMASQVWDRARTGFADRDEFERTIVPPLTLILASQRGVAWWAQMKSIYRPAFIADMEAAIPALQPTPSATAPQPAETAVAPPSNAG